MRLRPTLRASDTTTFRRPMSSLRDLALALLLGALALPSTANAKCAKDWIDIKSVEDDGAVELYAVNDRSVPIALTLRTWTRNMSADRSKVVVETVPPMSSKLLIVLSEIDPNKRWRYGFDCRWTVGSIDAKHDESVVYQFPYETGKSYYVLQGYGSRLSHTGAEEFTVDFYMHEGTPVRQDGGIAFQGMLERRLREIRQLHRGTAR